MTKFYFIYFILFLSLPLLSAAQKKQQKTGTIIIHLDRSEYGDISVQEAYVVFDKYDGTYAGLIEQKYPVINNEIVVDNVPQGKYYVDVFTLGNYHQHFTSVMNAGKKKNNYTLKFDDVAFRSTKAPGKNYYKQVAESSNVTTGSDDRSDISRR